MGETRAILLTFGKVAVVDTEDYKTMNCYKWHAKKGKQTFYAVRNTTEKGKRIKVYMHREILKASTEQCVDHKNNNGLDNRRCNLRLCSITQNNRNRRSAKNSMSKHKGIYWNKDARKWQAEIKCNGKHTKIGFFDDEITAAKAYDEKAKEVFGEFALLNFNE